MPPRLRVFYPIMVAVLLFLAALPLYREFTRNKDIWWTPHTMMVPVLDAGDRVEIYVRGRPVGALLEAGQLLLADGTGSNALRASEVGLRFNNWDRVRAAQLPSLLVAAAASGALVVALIFLLTGRLSYREERAPAAGVEPRLR